MRADDELAGYVREGLRRGHAPDALGADLGTAGWSPREVAQALQAWAPGGAGTGGLPVPRPRPYLSARDAVLYGLLFLALGNVLWGIGSLGWEVIERLVPEPSDFHDPPRGSMRYGIASLVVFGPVFWWLNRRMMRGTAADAGRARSLVRKWLASAALIVAAVVLMGDLVAVVYGGLSGDLTLRFAAKALWVALLAGLVLAYLRDEVDAA